MTTRPELRAPVTTPGARRSDPRDLGPVRPGPVGPPSQRLPSLEHTGLDVPLHLGTRARPARVAPEGTPNPAPAAASAVVRPRSLVVLAGLAGPALLVSALAVLLPWRFDVAANAAPGIIGSGFGVGALVVSAVLLAAVAADLLEGRVRWLALVAAPPVALLALDLAGVVAATMSPVSASGHLALAGVPWPGPVVSGVGVWMYFGAQGLCLLVGLAAARCWLRGLDGGSAPVASPRRVPVVLACVCAVAVAVAVSGLVLAHTDPTAAPAPTPAPSAPATPAAGG